MRVGWGIHQTSAPNHWENKTKQKSSPISYITSMLPCSCGMLLVRSYGLNQHSLNQSQVNKLTNNSITHNRGLVSDLFVSNLCGTVFWKTAFWHFSKDSLPKTVFQKTVPRKVGPIEFLDANPDSTLNSKQVVPTPVSIICINVTIWVQTWRFELKLIPHRST